MVILYLTTYPYARHNISEYSPSLFTEGENRIIQKVGEEAVEVVIAAKNNDTKELTSESADLLFHLLVLLVEKGVSLHDIEAELGRRHSR